MAAGRSAAACAAADQRPFAVTADVEGSRALESFISEEDIELLPPAPRPTPEHAITVLPINAGPDAPVMSVNADEFPSEAEDNALPDRVPIRFDKTTANLADDAPLDQFESETLANVRPALRWPKRTCLFIALLSASLIAVFILVKALEQANWSMFAPP